MPTLKERILEQIPMEDVFKEFGVPVYLLKNGKLFGDCPFCNLKKCVLITPQEYFCISCQLKGDVIDFTRRFMRLRLPEAILFLAEKFNISDCDSGDQDHLRSSEEAAPSSP